MSLFFIAILNPIAYILFNYSLKNFPPHPQVKCFLSLYSSFLPSFQFWTGRKYPTTRENTSHGVPLAFTSAAFNSAILAAISLFYIN